MTTAEFIGCGPKNQQAVERVLLEPALTLSFITEKLSNQLKFPKQKIDMHSWDKRDQQGC